MAANFFKLNSEKTQFLWLGTRQQLSRIHIDSLTVNSASIQIDSQATNLVVILDNHLSLLPHIRNVSKSCFFQLCQLWSIRRRITTSVAKGLAQAYVCCRLDYCNSSLYGASGKNLWHLQDRKSVV